MGFVILGEVMPVLSDLEWRKEDDKWVIRAPWKMYPAVNALDVHHRYQIITSDNRTYEGSFITYCYKKEKLDDVIVAVYLELQIPQGKVAICEHDVESVVEKGVV